MDPKSMRPLNGNILVERAKADERSSGGIIIPQSAQERTDRGYVRAVGPGKRLENGRRVEPELKVGDLVVFQKWAAGQPVSREFADFILVKDDDVLAVIEG